jgi:hypothetical protein
MMIALHDTTISLPGVNASKVSQLSIPIGLRGPMDNPAIYLDDQLLADALMQAGATELANRAQAEADKLTGKLSEKLQDELGEKAGDILGDGALDDAQKKLGEDVGGALKGLLGGNKSDEKKKSDE